MKRSPKVRLHVDGARVRCRRALVAWAICCAVASASARAQPTDEELRRHVAAKLQPAREEVRITPDSLPTLFPGLRLMRGERVPPMHSPEDPRPRVVTILKSIKGDTASVTNLRDFPRAWALAWQSGSVPRDSTRSAVLALLHGVGIVRPQQIVRSADEVRWRSAVLRDTTRVHEIEPPSQRRDGGRDIVSLTVDDFAGLMKLTFTIERGGMLSVAIDTLSRYKVSM